MDVGMSAKKRRVESTSLVNKTSLKNEILILIFPCQTGRGAGATCKKAVQRALTLAAPAYVAPPAPIYAPGTHLCFF